MQSARRPPYIAMSFHRLFLGGLLPSRARLRFTGRAYSTAPHRVGSIFVSSEGCGGCFLLDSTSPQTSLRQRTRGQMSFGSILREATDGYSGTFLNEAIRRIVTST
jgi:hypothetical protein